MQNDIAAVLSLVSIVASQALLTVMELPTIFSVTGDQGISLSDVMGAKAFLSSSPESASCNIFAHARVLNVLIIGNRSLPR